MSGITSYGKLPALGLVLLIGLQASLGAVVPQECDKSQCKGPIRFYEDLKCKPVYEKEADCCAVRYDCSHLNNRTNDKCYANGREYQIGENLADEDRSSSCDIACTCSKNYKDEAAFMCAYFDCAFLPEKEGCYIKSSFDDCCNNNQVCPKSDEEIATCEYNGTVYKDGQAFYPENDLHCICAKGYKGEFVEPFCKRSKCGTELRHSSDVRDNCSPVFFTYQKPSTSCSFEYRCQNNNDTVIRSSSVKSQSEGANDSDDMKCKFGNMMLRIGDELSQASSCDRCVCEVPPTLTCRRVSDDCYEKIDFTGTESPIIQTPFPFGQMD